MRRNVAEMRRRAGDFPLARLDLLPRLGRADNFRTGPRRAGGGVPVFRSKRGGCSRTGRSAAAGVTTDRFPGRTRPPTETLRIRADVSAWSHARTSHPANRPTEDHGRAIPRPFIIVLQMSKVRQAGRRDDLLPTDTLQTTLSARWTITSHDTHPTSRAISCNLVHWQSRKRYPNMRPGVQARALTQPVATTRHWIPTSGFGLPRSDKTPRQQQRMGYRGLGFHVGPARPLEFASSCHYIWRERDEDWPSEVCVGDADKSRRRVDQAIARRSASAPLPAH